MRSISAVIVLLESDLSKRVGLITTFLGIAWLLVVPLEGQSLILQKTREQLEYMINYDTSLSKIAMPWGVKEHNKATCPRIRHFGAIARRDFKRQ